MLKATVVVNFFDIDKGVSYKVGDTLSLSEEEAAYFSRLHWVKLEEKEKPVRTTRKKTTEEK